jgi:hypothetical protein
MPKQTKRFAIVLVVSLALVVILSACGSNTYWSGGSSSNPGYNNGSNSSPNYYHNNIDVGPLPQPDGPVNSDPCSFSDGNSSVEQECHIWNSDGSNPDGYGPGYDPSSDGSSDDSSGG